MDSVSHNCFLFSNIQPNDTIVYQGNKFQNVPISSFSGFTGSTGTTGATGSFDGTLTGTTREVEVTGTQIGLPDIVHVGATDNYTSTGVDTDLLYVGASIIQGTGNKQRSILFGSSFNNLNATITDSFVGGSDVDITTTGSVALGSMVIGEGLRITGGTVQFGAAIIGRDTIHSAGTIEGGSMIIGQVHNISNNVREGSLVLGRANTTSGLLDTGFVVGESITTSNTIQTGALVGGYLNNISGVARNGSFVFGRDISTTTTVDAGFVMGQGHTCTSTITAGSMVGGLFHTISQPVSNGSFVWGSNIQLDRSVFNGSFCLGSGLLRQGIAGLENGEFMLGGNISTFGSGQRSQTMGKNIQLTTTSRTNLVICGSPAADANSGSFYNAGATDPTQWQFDNTNTPEGLALAGDNITIVSKTNGTIEFINKRPQCSESSYPTTNADDLPSKSYVDAYSATTPADWATSAPTTIQDAIDRLASAYTAIHGAVP